MNIYVGNTKKKAEKISLFDLLTHVLSVNGFNMDNCICDPNRDGLNGCAIVGVKLKDKLQEISINLCFDDVDGVRDLNKINRIDIWQAPIVTKVDYDKQKQLISNGQTNNNS